MFYNFRMEPEGSMISCKKYFLSVPNFLMSKIQNMTFFTEQRITGLEFCLIHIKTVTQIWYTLRNNLLKHC